MGSVSDGWSIPGIDQARVQALLAKEPHLKDTYPLPETAKLIGSDKLRSIEIVKIVCESYANRVAMKWCRDGAENADYDIQLTYHDIWNRVKALAQGIHECKLVRRGDFIGICGFSSADWMIADIMALYLGLVVVPLPLNVPPKDLIHILTESECKLVFMSAEELTSIVSVLPKCPDVETLVLMDLQVGQDDIGRWMTPEVTKSLPSTVKMTTCMNSLVSKGQQSTAPQMPYAVPGQDGMEEDPLLGLMYTSGSTGSPKGAMYPERLVVQIWRAGFNWRDGNVPCVQLGFLPLNHIAGRVSMYQTLSKGGVVYFVRKADMSTLFEDMAAARPTSMMLVPRLANMAYETYKILRAERIKEGVKESEELEGELRRIVRDDIMGGRLLQIVIGSAPSSPEVLEFLSKACEVPFIEGYGSTELGGITIDGHINPRNVVAARLIDVPELGYTTKDRPYPRGELLCKTTTSIPGYFKNPAATADLIDEEGFFHTGDIMEQRGPDVFIWVDRRKNIIKLSQGEYVSISRLEAMYSGHADIDHVYLYGNSRYSYLVGVFVPGESLKDSLKASCANEDALKDKLKPLLRQRLDAVAKENSVESYEIPRDFIVELAPFSRANNLLTDSNKIARGRLRERYGEALEQIYIETEQRRMKRLEAVMSNDQLQVVDYVKAALEMTLGIAERDLDLEATFAQLGGDSLSAVRVTEHLRSLCPIKVADLLNPTATLASLVSHIETMRINAAVAGGLTPSDQAYQSLHGTMDEVTLIYAADVAIEKVIPEAEIYREPGPWAAVQASTEPPKVVFLTGANGFLGRFLLLELLNKVGPTGRVICIVRASTDATAKERLLSAVGPKAGEGMRALIEQHEKKLEIYAGDVTQERMGLKEHVYTDLCETVDSVVHAGALVNHTLSYKELFAPNVWGTINIMRFCLSGPRPKPLHFISTVAVAMAEDSPHIVTEKHMGSHLSLQRKTAGTYAAGYGTSKWVCEVLMEKLYAACGLPMAAYRCSMILPHTTLPGQINASDVFTRMLAGLIYTGLAPSSLTDGQGRPPAYDGNPVDFDANAIIEIASARQSGCHLYHVVNPHHDDGASFEDIIGWVASAGYSIDRMKSYSGWYETFKSRLDHLPNDRKAHSPLLVVHQWERPMRPRDAVHIRLDASEFRKVVQELTAWKDVPQLDEAYIHTCLNHMVLLGLIRAPM